MRGTRRQSSLRHCATTRKVAGSISDRVNDAPHWHNASDRIMAVRSTQPLTEMCTRNISYGVKRPVHKADNLTTSMYRMSWNLGTSSSWIPHGVYMERFKFNFYPNVILRVFLLWRISFIQYLFIVMYKTNRLQAEIIFLCIKFVFYEFYMWVSVQHKSII